MPGEHRLCHRQILDLVANGITHVHLYAMNRPDIAGRIMANLSELFPCA